MKITLCGSTRFIDEFHFHNRGLTLSGHTVYSVAVPTTGSPGESEIQEYDKLLLDAIHMSKIANSDAIAVLNMGGYFGTSTAREIMFAQIMDKKIFYWDLGTEAIKKLMEYGANIHMPRDFSDKFVDLYAFK